MAESQGIYGMMMSVVGRSIIQESTNLATLPQARELRSSSVVSQAYPATIHIHNQNEAVEFSDGIDAGCTNARLAFLGVP